MICHTPRSRFSSNELSISTSTPIRAVLGATADPAKSAHHNNLTFYLSHAKAWQLKNFGLDNNNGNNNNNCGLLAITIAGLTHIMLSNLLRQNYFEPTSLLSIACATMLLLAPTIWLQSSNGGSLCSDAAIIFI